MQPIRQIVDDAPDSIPVPEAMRHRRIELIFWPLEEEEQPQRPPRPKFDIAQVDHIDIPSREERNVRR